MAGTPVPCLQAVIGLAMTLSFDKEKQLSLLRLEGEIGIGSAAEIKAFLLEALSVGKETRVDLEHVTDLDVTALQLLWAAQQAFTAAGVKLELANPMPESLVSRLPDMGFEGFSLRTPKWTSTDRS
jgi:anti-anti-sigma factor